MNIEKLEPFLRDATIKAIDGVAKQLTKSEKAAETAIGRLLNRWKHLEDDEKEHVAGIVIATATTAATAFIALRQRSNTPSKKAARALKRVTGKLT